MPAKTRVANEARVEEILDAAQSVFMERGFSGATTDEIARVARASKTTLYGLFGNKETLFRTLLERRFAPAEIAFELNRDEPIPAVIHRLVLGVVKSVIAPDAIALVRIAAAEAVRFPELKQVMAENLRYDALAVYLRACRSKGQMAFKDADAMAIMLITMAQGDWTVRALYGLIGKVSAKELEAHAALVTDMFLAAVKPKR